MATRFLPPRPGRGGRSRHEAEKIAVPSASTVSEANALLYMPVGQSTSSSRHCAFLRSAPVGVLLPGLLDWKERGRVTGNPGLPRRPARLRPSGVPPPACIAGTAKAPT
jgi:hypothetical protein